MNPTANGIRFKVGSIIGGIFRKETHFVFEKTLTEASVSTETLTNFDLRIIQRDELEKFASDFPKFDVTPFADADVCIVAKCDGNLVHWTFVAFDQAYVCEIERKICIDPNSAYLYAVYTVPNYRRLGIASNARARIFKYLHENGVQNVNILTRHNNFPMLRALQKESARKIGSITHFKIFNLNFYKLRGETKDDNKKLAKMFPTEKTRAS